MASMTNTRVRLMLGCGGAALSLSLANSAQEAQAQAFQASEAVVQGLASRTATGPNSETITVDTPTAVIDWTPQEDALGNALDFLPVGAVANFENNGSDNPGADFAVLNRILPSTNGNITVMDGSVISRIVDFQAGSSVAGGTVAFYSPTGILVGGNASFDVGNLILTTLEPDLASFDSFTTAGGTLVLNGAASPVARIQIDPGAQITATADNSYFAAIAADVQMLGNSSVNGSQAYVAGEVVNLTFSNGLFDIEVPVGTALGGQVMELNGEVGGPSSTGAGDNHLIYAVAKASTNPISMLFRGNLGFAPAATAGIVNGEIILSANSDVFGRTVRNGSISDGINAVFDEQPDPFASPIARADILVEDFAATSSLLAIGTDLVQASALNSASSVEGNLLVVGREEAQVSSNNGQVFEVSGDVLASSRAFGVVGSDLSDPTVINAEGGTAFIDAFNGGELTIGGSALANADAVGGANLDSFEAGTATGGSAQIGAINGILTILGDATVSAEARGTTQASLISTGATSTGGFAQIFASEGGSLIVNGSAFARASAFGIDVDTINPSTASDAIGGRAAIEIFGTGGGSIAVGLDATLRADATGGVSNGAGPGGLGRGGEADLFIENADTITIGGGLTMHARGRGGDNFGSGTGGEGRGGSARAFLANGGTLGVGIALSAFADAIGGQGTTGGDALGGAAGIEVFTGFADIAGPALASAEATGGNADFGFGGDGGNAFGGLAFVQATGSLSDTATINAGGALATSAARGGRGGAANSDFAAGRGGGATGGDFSTFNQAAPDFNNGSFVLAGADNGTLRIIGGGDVEVDASAEGGAGGSGTLSRAGGEGGFGQGGLAQAGLALFGLDGSVAQGNFDIQRLFLEANGVGGAGGDAIVEGNGGEGRGGFAAFTVRAGNASADTIEMFADGFGGDGGISGDGLGGAAGMIGALGSALTVNRVELFARGRGGGGAGSGTGGGGIGGEVFFDLEGIDVTINGDVEFNASGEAGQDADTGFAEGGSAQIFMTGSTLSAGRIDLIAFADATTSTTGANGGSAFAGLTEAIVEGDSTLAVTELVFDSRAVTTAGGSAAGGEALLAVGSPSGRGEVGIADRLTLLADATGGDFNFVGRFEVSSTSGQLSTANLVGTALGDTLGDFEPSRLDALGGDILVSSTLSVDVFDDFIVGAGQGTLIGGPNLLAPTVAIAITSQGSISFFGDNDSVIDFGGLSMALTSRDIAIENGARIGAVTMDFASLDGIDPAVLGGPGTPSGDVAGEGYTLIAEELARLEVGSFTFTQPELLDAGPNDPDVILRDATVIGSFDPDGGISDVLIRTEGAGGIIRVAGLVEVINAAPTDTFTLETGTRIEVVTPGGIVLSDTDGLPAGELQLDALDIWVADADLITQLQADPSFSGRNDGLAVALTGSDDPLGYLRAGRVDLVVGQSLLVRNTGSNTAQGGITVGDGGLSIRAGQISQSDLDVFAYGRRQRDDGSFVTGSIFFSEVNFNTNVGSTIYLDASEFNDCIINSGECPTAITPPNIDDEIAEVIAVINNQSVIEEVTEVPPEELSLTEQETNDEFGVDFPGLIEAPLLTEDPLLDDPVASGGDSSAYGTGGPEGDDDDE